jgi:hypothetical protein
METLTLIQLVKRYQESRDPKERLELADRIVVILSPDLHLYIARRARAEMEDVLQEALCAIAVNFDKFVGDMKERFYRYCYVVTGWKVIAALRKAGRISAHEFTGDELWDAVLESEKTDPLTTEERERLREALDLLSVFRQRRPLARQRGNEAMFTTGEGTGSRFMAESIEETEQKLTRLGERVRAGWAKLHPAKQEHRDAVQRALHQQMRQQQEIQKSKQNLAKTAEQKAEEKPRHRHGY